MAFAILTFSFLIRIDQDKETGHYGSFPLETMPSCVQMLPSWYTEAIRKRFKTFIEESLPVKGHYEGKRAEFHRRVS